jgi:CRISPR/Cas system CMR-associated protein Cmr3 (group 5 of RAMP superfamily)
MWFHPNGKIPENTPTRAKYADLECFGCWKKRERKGKGKVYYLTPSVLDVIGTTRKLLHLLEIITISHANIVSTNGLKAGVQVWQKKINHRRSNVKLE